MTYITLEGLIEKEVVPGFHGRFIHSEHITMAFWHVEPGAVLPEHAHVHEQITTVLEGEFELCVAGETGILKPGMAAVIASNVPHSAKALTPCRLVDAFYPVRADYRGS
jgi:quercetin dioxygenase-like cupin family protein